jgi:group I intron endonuclease
MGYIYSITNRINNKKYIGQTINKDVEYRWKQHKGMYKNASCSCLLRAFKKYGIDNFDFKLICICFDEDCNRYEIEYIQKFNSIAPNGYNLLPGGNNKSHHPETREKLSKSHLGKKATIETKIKMSNSAQKGENHRYYKSMPQHILEAVSISREKQKKKVNQYDLGGNILNTYESIASASRQTSINKSNIANTCRGVKNHATAGGFIWKFAN